MKGDVTESDLPVDPAVVGQAVANGSAGLEIVNILNGSGAPKSVVAFEFPNAVVGFEFPNAVVAFEFPNASVGFEFPNAGVAFEFPKAVVTVAVNGSSLFSNGSAPEIRF